MYRPFLLPAFIVSASVLLATVPFGYTRAQTPAADPVKAETVTAGGYARGTCLSFSEGRRVLQSSNAISLGSAVQVARNSTPGEIVDYKICQAPSGYSYVLTILGGNGKVSRAWVDALSGKLLSVK